MRKNFLSGLFISKDLFFIILEAKDIELRQVPTACSISFS
jgi:hypothetical protein